MNASIIKKKGNKMYYINPEIEKIYRKNPPEGRFPFIRLDQNENPDGLPLWFFNKVIKELTPSYLAMYPEEGALTSKISKKFGLHDGSVTLTDGSVVGMDYIIKVFGEKGKDIVCVTPTFAMYGVYADMVGMNLISVPYERDFTFSIKNILNSINNNTRIVVLVNPNMPVGNVYSKDEIREVLKKANSVNAIVVVDEAYYYFYDGTAIALLKEYNNLIILRTFSKMLACTGLRLGVIISNSQIIRFINNYKPPYTVNAVALLFGERILDNYQQLLPELEHNFEEGKTFVLKELDNLGYETLKSYGCFVCIKVKHRSVVEIRDELKKRGILILAGIGPLSEYLRLTICAKKYMKIFIDNLVEVDN
jgi:histidinol-phosphate aminotransferase